MFRSYLAAWLMLMGTALLGACAGMPVNTPERTIQRFYQALDNNNTDFALDQVLEPDESFDREKQRSAIKEMHATMRANGGLARAETLRLNLTDHDTRANARIKVVFRNGKEKDETIQLVLRGDAWKIKL